MPMSAGQDLDRLADRLGIDAAEVARRRAWVGLSDADERILVTLHEPLRRVRDGFVRGFYDYLRRFDETAVLIEEPGVVERLAAMQSAYFERLTQGDYGVAYAVDRLRIGLVHHRVGLAPKWYLGGFHRYLSALAPALASLAPDGQAWVSSVRALVRVVLFDVSLAMDAYLGLRARALTAGAGDAPDLDAPVRAADASPARAAATLRALGIDAGEAARRRAFLGIEPAEGRSPLPFAPLLKAAWAGLPREIAALTDAPAIVAAHAAIVAEAGDAYLSELADGPRGRERSVALARVGLCLHAYDVPPRWYLGAVARVLAAAAGTVLDATRGDPHRAATAFCAIQRALFLDVGIVVDAYAHASEAPLMDARGEADAVAASLPSGLLTLDADLVVRSANAGAGVILGVDAARLTGSPLEAVLPSPLLRHSALGAMEDGQPRSNLFVDLSAPERRLLRVAISVVDRGPADERRVVVLLDDVTGVSQLRCHAEASDWRFRALVEGVDAVVCEAQPSPFRFTFVSPQVRTLLGVAPGEWLASPHAWLGRIHPDDADAVRAERARLGRGAAGTTSAVQYRFDAGDGRFVWIQQRCQVIRDPSGRLVVRGVLMDVTSLKAIEDALRRERGFLQTILDTAGAAGALRAQPCAGTGPTARCSGTPTATPTRTGRWPASSSWAWT